MTEGECRLCGAIGPLSESHVIPKFIFRWMKETSGTGYLRFGQNPNRRVQDGPKDFWLCGSCEERLSGFETAFAQNVFYPFCNGVTSRVEYGPWMLKFAVSLSWRVALKMQMEGGNHHLTDSHHASLRQAMTVWREFLLDLRPHPDEHEQHLLPVDSVNGVSGPSAPANLNRYFLRGIEMDLVAASPSDCFVYTKIPRFILIGFVAMKRPRAWVGTKLHLKKGELGPRKYDLPGGFGEYLVERCKRLESTKRKISAAQWDRIKNALRSNPDRAANSDAFRALQLDVELSGRNAVFPQDQNEP